MNKVILTSAIVALMFTGCGFTQSALEYSYEGTKRVQAGYEAKAKMTDSLTKYLTEANKGCGVKVEIINNTPVTTVKECVRASDVLSSIDRVEIVKPQAIKDMADSAGDFIMKATNVVVPVAGVYYNYKTHQSSMDASMTNTASNNAMQSSIFNGYTSNFQNTQTTTNSEVSTSVENASVTDTSSAQTTTVPDYTDGTVTIGD